MIFIPWELSKEDFPNSLQVQLSFVVFVSTERVRLLIHALHLNRILPDAIPKSRKWIFPRANYTRLSKAIRCIAACLYVFTNFWTSKLVDISVGPRNIERNFAATIRTFRSREIYYTTHQIQFPHF